MCEEVVAMAGNALITRKPGVLTPAEFYDLKEAIKLSGIMQRVQVPLLEILDTSGGRRSLIHG